MGLKDTLFGLIDNIGLSEVFSRKQADPKTLRAPLLKGIGNAKRQFESGVTRAPNRWWKVSNGVVALTVKVAGDTFDINGVATNHMPENRFVEFLDAFRAAVEAGEFDEELAHKGNGDGKVVIPKTKRLGSISPEAAKARGVKAAESRARNRAASIEQDLPTAAESKSPEEAEGVTPKASKRGRVKAQPSK